MGTRPVRRGASRRDFLKAGAAVVASAAPYFVPASVFGAGTPSNRITLGCIGVGNQGTPIMQRFLAFADCQVVAVCDVNRGSHGYKTPEQFLGREPAQHLVEQHYAEKTRAGSYGGCQAYVDFRELLAHDDVDAVTVCTPDHWHAPITVAAARAKKDVYCEKPLGLTVAAGQAMVKAVREHGIVFQTGSQERSTPLARQACELVRNGYIGKVQSVLTNVGFHSKVGPGPGWHEMPVPDGFDYDLWLGPAPLAPYHQDRCLYNFRFFYDYSGGQVTNYGAHSNDMAQWGLGMDDTGPVEVECLQAEFLPKGSLFDAATVTKFRCRYSNGIELVCQTGKPSERIEFVGSEGRISIENEGHNFQTSPASLARVKLRDDQVLYKSDDHQRNFLDCIKSRKDPAARVELGHRSANVCHIGNIAIRLNAKLQWDPTAERFVGNNEANSYLERLMRKPWQI